MNGASLGPAPAFQTRASNSRLTRSSWRTWPHLKLRRKVPRVEGALAVKPSTRAVPPARSTSASSMQSPPARAEATRVIILSPVFARPGAPPRSRCFRRSWGRPRRRARVAGRISPALATRRWVVKEDADTVGFVLWQHLLGAPFLGPVFCFKTIIPDSQEHPLASSRAVPKAVLRWIRAWVYLGNPGLTLL